jgi:hypothetical protein
MDSVSEVPKPLSHDRIGQGPGDDIGQEHPFAEFPAEEENDGGNGNAVIGSPDRKSKRVTGKKREQFLCQDDDQNSSTLLSHRLPRSLKTDKVGRKRTHLSGKGQKISAIRFTPSGGPGWD